MGEAESDGGGDEKPREKSNALRGVIITAALTLLGGIIGVLWKGYYDLALTSHSHPSWLSTILSAAVPISLLLFAAVYLLQQRKLEDNASSKVEEAEMRAFSSLVSQEALYWKEHAGRQSLELPALFNLYSQQIAKYQVETRFRANWSFGWAVIAMLGGLTILLFGAWHVFDGGDAVHVIPTSAVTVVGAAISGFIAKTFLDVHQTSLNQLNHYFKQPVLNSHILTAQRLVELLEHGDQQAAIKEMIKAVLQLIPAEQAQSAVLSPIETKGFKDSSGSSPKKPRRKRQPIVATQVNSDEN